LDWSCFGVRSWIEGACNRSSRFASRLQRRWCTELEVHAPICTETAETRDEMRTGPASLRRGACFVATSPVKPLQGVAEGIGEVKFWVGNVDGKVSQVLPVFQVSGIDLHTSTLGLPPGNSTSPDSLRFEDTVPPKRVQRHRLFWMSPGPTAGSWDYRNSQAAIRACNSWASIATMAIPRRFASSTTLS